ncbi:hypothetical protein STEG23_027360 [Scotinomys teguina]
MQQGEGTRPQGGREDVGDKQKHYIEDFKEIIGRKVKGRLEMKKSSFVWTCQYCFRKQVKNTPELIKDLLNLEPCMFLSSVHTMLSGALALSHNVKLNTVMPPDLFSVLVTASAIQVAVVLCKGEDSFLVLGRMSLMSG